MPWEYGRRSCLRKHLRSEDGAHLQNANSLSLPIDNNLIFCYIDVQPRTILGASTMKLEYKAINPEDQATADKLLSKVTVDENGCWRYRATSSFDVYNGHRTRRKFYSIFVNSTKDKSCFVSTTCGNNYCLNPDHLQRLPKSLMSTHASKARTLAPFERCNKHVHKLPNGCWRWYTLDGKKCQPLVRDHHNNMTVTAAQFVWSAYRNKVLPAGLMLKSTCGDTLCVNPEHKEVVSRTCLIKPKYGTEVYSHVLTEDQVIAMRCLRETTGMRFDKIAEKFGVSPRTAWLVCTYRAWKHIQKQ